MRVALRRRADLSGADLSGANLFRANLFRAYLFIGGVKFEVRRA
jgi:uncharacterized protein YjbI with pentapeptide repeats